MRNSLFNTAHLASTDHYCSFCITGNMDTFDVHGKFGWKIVEYAGKIWLKIDNLDMDLYTLDTDVHRRIQHYIF